MIEQGLSQGKNNNEYNSELPIWVVIVNVLETMGCVIYELQCWYKRVELLKRKEKIHIDL